MKHLAGKSIPDWKKEHPILQDVSDKKEVFWTNPDYRGQHKPENLHPDAIEAAEKRLERFAPLIQTIFPETKAENGLIESPLRNIPALKAAIEDQYETKIDGRLLVKCDHDLPISGSIKARGGIYEVLKFAEETAIAGGMLALSDNYSVLNTDPFKKLFSRYQLSVGSTGNLGLSIGIMGAALGFQVTVHMSMDAKQWKKDLLRNKGVTVKEYEDDYSKAVEEGRKQALTDSRCHFIDDENSEDLFLGYATAASRLKRQLKEKGILVDHDHPLFVYLPCGVGGGPGGVAFGLKQIFQENVHCFFAEPTHSPCFLLGLVTGLHNGVSVQDFDLDNRTAADGLAVGRASGFVGKTVGQMLSGSYTINDDRLFSLLKTTADTENIYLEPSALAGFYGPVQLFNEASGKQFLNEQGLNEKMKNATHIVWATGGSMVPKEEIERYYLRGSEI
ncbi:MULTISPECIES: D-serine ammonia-lyase [Bacillus]|uniref:Probable D-serine dehydratase n=2 Tax=Bacillus TaxID=1386 RepID=A0A0M3RAA8_9BACI|nr:MULTISPECIES: D-serine ammonia-lyase [Bacillus]ALC82862.1 serine ammonia-lyase [Bacillus gobiensis]MBP1081829.1 D-serine dehydratase [Bacillus capparidis]MED1096478.1 D-serine ammonia-lyase [Bacillus capparidis]